MIDPQTIAKILDAAKIEEVVSEFITLRKAGVNRKGLCPFHNEKTPSFSVSPSKNIFHCFGCGEGGNSVNFLMKIEHLSYVDALKYLAKKYGIEIEEREFTAEEKKIAGERESMFIVNEFAAKYFQENLWNSEEGKAIGLSYFRERGLDDNTIKTFQLGYAFQQRDSFTNTARSKGYNIKYLRNVGLSKEGQYGGDYDFFAARVMFPFFSLSGKIIGFGGRILTADKTAKYINSQESEIFSKSNNLFGIFHSKQEIIKQNKCFLVEGNIDFISLYQAGIKNAVASLGTSLTKEQAHIIHRFTENISILYDGDSAGIKAAKRAVKILLEEGFNVRILLFPDSEDPDSFVRKHGATATIDYITNNEKDLIEFESFLYSQEKFQSPEKKSDSINEILNNIALIKNDITASFFINKCAELFEINEKILINSFSKIKKNYIEEEQKQKKSFYQNPEQNFEQTIIQNTQKQNNLNNNNNIFDRSEKEIIRILIMYGNNFIQYGDNQYSVSEIIFNNLEGDNLTLKNSVLNEIINYSRELLSEGKEISESLFTNHINPQISEIVSSILKPQPEIKIGNKQSTFVSEKNRLDEIIADIFIKYKTNILKERISNIKEKIKTPSLYSEEELDTFFEKLKILEDAKKKLGDIQNRPLR